MTLITGIKKLINNSRYGRAVAWRAVYITGATRLYGELDFVLDAFAKTRVCPISFVQVGSNDGSSNDPIARYINDFGWSGIMVEPMPGPFAKLQQCRSGNPHVFLENVAIADQEGVKPFFFISPSVNSSYALDQLGSFVKETLLHHDFLIPNIGDYIQETSVPCVPLAKLCHKHNFSKVDALHIDTEGYDFEIIKSVDLDALEVSLLLYEHCHLSKQDQVLCRDYLTARGFSVAPFTSDTIAIRKAEITQHSLLQRSWRLAIAKKEDYTAPSA